MAKKVYKKGEKYSPRELMELAIEKMHYSVPEHKDRTDPKVGAVLAKEDGTLINTAFRGELRQGDHAEFTVLERKHRSDILEGHVIYATLEPCAPGARSNTKLGCAERIYNARIKKVYVGIEDPDPKVKGNGLAYLIKNNIDVVSFDKDLKESIAIANSQFIKEAEERATKAELEELFPVNALLDEALENYSLTDFSEEALNKFKDRLRIDYSIESKEFKSVLKKWNFIRSNNITNAFHITGLGLLLFGKDPQIQYPQSLIKFTIRTKDENKPKILDFSGPLILIPEKIESYLEINFPKAIDRSTFARREIKEIYFEVLREVIINAIIHRDYTIAGANINVKIDDDKIEVQSPGKPLVPIEKLKNYSAPTFSTNPKIANVFYQMKFVEKRNLGMEELKEFTAIHGVRRPIIEFNEPYLSVVLFRKPEVKEEISINDVLEFIKESGNISTGNYASRFKVSSKTASRHLNKLFADGVIDKTGEKKGTKYFIKK